MAAPLEPRPVNLPQSAERLWERGTPCPYDEVIDVRAPVEYLEDHLPGAVNLPVLSDAERAEVGTLYRHEGSFAAGKVGAAYVSANIAQHLREHFAGTGRDYKPLLYCWRGGQRSSSMAHVLAQVGWRVTVLKGGYKNYRGHVRRELEAVPALFEYRIIAGATGTGKTRLLHALAARGAQVLDLEGLAKHRGSVLGGGEVQPTQKHFDSLLLTAFDRLKADAPVWVEAESNRIGNVYLPSILWAKMQASGGIEVQVPTAGRIQHLVAEYANMIAEPELLTEKLRLLTARHGPRQIEAWCHFTNAGQWDALVESLLMVHYDPAYTASTERCYPNVTRLEPIENATAPTLEALAGRLHPESADPAA